MLIEEGKSYTFDNFCLPRSDYSGQFGGYDTPEWSTFKIRVKNIVSALVADNSPAMQLVKHGLTTYTEGNGADKFELAKSNLIKADHHYFMTKRKLTHCLFILVLYFFSLKRGYFNSIQYL